MKFGTWKVRSLYKASLLMAAVKEPTKCKLDLVEVQEFRRNRGGTKPEGEYTFFCGKGNENRESGTGFCVHKRIISAFQRAEFVSDRLVLHLCSECPYPNRG
jgi:hypothetical protein